MNVQAAARIVALRPCIEALIVRTCLNPGTTNQVHEDDNKLIKILKQLSSPFGWSPNEEIAETQQGYAGVEAISCPNYSSGYFLEYFKVTLT